MDNIISAAIDSIWLRAAEPRQLFTPDDNAARSFDITASSQGTITIITERGSTLVLQRAAFHSTLQYLILNRHNAEKPCEIRSNGAYDDAGALCRVARDANGRTRVINYIAPILADAGFITINGNRPNSVCLN